MICDLLRLTKKQLKKERQMKYEHTMAAMG
jgi:hypothetical protein